MLNNVIQNKKYVSCVFILYAASLCVSKFGISFFGAILAFLGLFYFLTAKKLSTLIPSPKVKPKAV